MATKAPSLSERFFVVLFDVATRLNRLRERRQGAAQWVSSGITILFSTGVVLLYEKIAGPDRGLGLGGKGAVALVVGFLFNRVFLNGLLPTLEYARLSIAMREMGLEKVVAEPGKYTQVVSDCLRNHKPEETVKVICISGKYLFRCEHMEDGKTECPLHNLAMKGKLHVIIPDQSEANPTIHARYATYSESYKQKNNFTRIEDLVEDTALGKSFLQTYQNTVTEHKMLCMWRVVVFSEQCIVQSYFPNYQSQESYLAPVFVFNRKDQQTEGLCYYDTFSQMFELIARYGTSK